MKRPRHAAPVPSMLCLCESGIPDTMGMFAEHKGAAYQICETKILEKLHIENQAEKYSGATFAFDALFAAKDDEIIWDIETIKSVAGEVMFPIGTVAPDGISFVSEEGKIYTAFNDNIYLSGETIELYLNMMFIKSLKPTRLYKI